MNEWVEVLFKFMMALGVIGLLTIGLFRLAAAVKDWKKK